MPPRLGVSMFLLVRASGIIEYIWQWQENVGQEYRKWTKLNWHVEVCNLWSFWWCWRHHIKKSNRKIARGLPKLIPRLVVAASVIVVGISGRTVSIRIPMARILLFWPLARWTALSRVDPTRCKRSSLCLAFALTNWTPRTWWNWIWRRVSAPHPDWRG